MKIAVITSGGDAPGMNACIRAVTRYAINRGIEVCAFQCGYKGILEDKYIDLNRKSASNVIHTGGTFIQTDRSKEFLEKRYRDKAAEILRGHNIDALIVIGGDGSFHGALDLYNDEGFNVMAIPETIDNDLAYTELTLGFDTAVNNVLWAINTLRDTMQSHNKVTVVEVMGRHCGDIALHAGMTGGAEYILIPEIPYDMDEICSGILQSEKQGKRSNLIVIAEGACRMEEFCAEFEKKTGIIPRQTRLGFIQRGGSPTHIDRYIGSLFGIYAVKAIIEGKRCRAIGLQQSKVYDIDIGDALKMKKTADVELYKEIMEIK